RLKPSGEEAPSAVPAKVLSFFEEASVPVPEKPRVDALPVPEVETFSQKALVTAVKTEPTEESVTIQSAIPEIPAESVSLHVIKPEPIPVHAVEQTPAQEFPPETKAMEFLPAVPVEPVSEEIPAIEQEPDVKPAELVKPESDLEADLSLL